MTSWLMATGAHCAVPVGPPERVAAADERDLPHGPKTAVLGR